MMKHVSMNSLTDSMDDDDVEHYPPGVTFLVWLSVMLFGVLFWVAVLSLL